MFNIFFLQIILANTSMIVKVKVLCLKTIDFRSLIILLKILPDSVKLLYPKIGTDTVNQQIIYLQKFNIFFC